MALHLQIMNKGKSVLAYSYVGASGIKIYTNNLLNESSKCVKTQEFF